MAKTRVKIELTGYKELLDILNRIDETLVNRTSRDMVKAAGEVVAARARELCPLSDGAYDGNKPPLAETIRVEIKNYGANTLAIIGQYYQQYGGGNHGHLVEYGHELRARGPEGKKSPGKWIGRRAKPQPFLRPAIDGTHAQQREAMEAVISKALRELGAT
jgi:HK97 gp10 family phage protein